jgi:hypothetical protein
MVDWYNIGNSILLASIVLGLFALIGFMYYVDYKRKQGQKEQRMDPVTKGVLISGLWISVWLLGELFGFLERGWNGKHWWLHVVFVTVTIMIFLWVARRLNPLSYEKQRRIALDHAIREFRGQEYVGKADVPTLKQYKISEDGPRKELRGLVGNFLFELWSRPLLYRCWVRIDVYTGIILHIQPNPPFRLGRKLTDESPAVQPDAILKEFGQEKGSELA